MLVDADKAREKLANMALGLINGYDLAAAIRQADLTDCRVEADETKDVIKALNMQVNGMEQYATSKVCLKATLVIESLSAQVAELKKALEIRSTIYQHCET